MKLNAMRLSNQTLDKEEDELGRLTARERLRDLQPVKVSVEP
jgi:hypothetical protein